MGKQVMLSIEALVSAVASDAFSILTNQVPTASAANFLGTAINRFVTNRQRESTEILIQEIRNGDRLPNEYEAEIFIGLTARYYGAVKIGAANRNLKLMAQVIANGALVDCPFKPDILASNMDLLRDLRRDEIQVIARLWSNYQSENKPTKAERNISATERTAQELTNLVFTTEDDFYACLNAVTRTGLVYQQRTIDLGYGFSSRFDEVASLCDLIVIDSN